MDHSKLIILGAALGITLGGLTGCMSHEERRQYDAQLAAARLEKQENRSQPNQCIRAELFKQCMSVLPVGPAATKYNDWQEVVEECGDQAKSMSWRITKSIPLECRSEVPYVDN